MHVYFTLSGPEFERPWIRVDATVEGNILIFDFLSRISIGEMASPETQATVTVFALASWALGL
jgi:hypothetical protein